MLGRFLNQYNTILAMPEDTMERKNIKLKRFKQIANSLFKQGMGYAVEQMDLKHHLTFHKDYKKMSSQSL